jgi:DNA-binding transcriptional LysR family regulator
MAVNSQSTDIGIELTDASDRWFRIFDVAATTGSFTRAAKFLGVGQPAVSYAIKRLEAAIGVSLFDRLPTGIKLTTAGSELHRHTRSAFLTLQSGVTAAQATAKPDNQIGLSVSTSFATYWLMPRLSRFRQRHPTAQLRCITNDTDARVGRDGADIWIPLGTGPWPGFDVAPLTDEEIYLVANPAVARRVASAGALRGSDLIHLEERYTPRFDWVRWFASHPQLPPPDLGQGATFNDYSTVVQAALDGQGVALGWHHIVTALVDDGRLVRLDDRTVTTASPFVVLTRPQLVEPPLVTSLRHWLIRELADT